MTTSYKSCTSMLDGLTYTLPLMVFACVEELYCAGASLLHLFAANSGSSSFYLLGWMIGLRSSRLLRPPSHAPTKPTHTVSHCPDHSRSATHSYPALLAAFNTPPTYGNDIDLAFASLDDVGALLLTYLDCLPGGIIPVWMRRVLGDAVSIYEENGDGGSASMRERKRAIRVAQLVLRLLPTTQFNLLAYLLGFLSQVPLYEVWNGWNVRGVARAFARIVVGVGAGARAGDVSGTRRIDCLKNGKGDWKHTAEDVDWVAEEEDAVDVLQWLLVNWDEISGCLSLDAQPPEGQGRHVNYQYGERDGTEERETHGAAVMKRLDPPHTVRSEDVSATKFDPAASHPSLNDLLARIADLERENSKWKWLQGLHESELRLMFQAGERGTGEVEKALLEERSAREMVEDALMKERAALMNTQTSIENAVRAERRFWVEEVQALGNAWAGVGKTMAEVGSIIGVIVERGREENAQ
ncbi:hypothetical protein JB92DRAFT_463624 [Gautieria morchelliformis]|nr:hypothetical protein JB92DRAFT_463624 [Gautieria morchelliformis]